LLIRRWRAGGIFAVDDVSVSGLAGGVTGEGSVPETGTRSIDICIDTRAGSCIRIRSRACVRSRARACVCVLADPVSGIRIRVQTRIGARTCCGSAVAASACFGIRIRACLRTPTSSALRRAFGADIVPL
jgi:hypothetical protein